MDNAKVVVFEDDQFFRERAVRKVELGGHNVVATADTLPRALTVVEQMAAGKLACDVVLLDGNLDKTKDDGSDARAITDAIRKSDRLKKVKIVGISIKYLKSDYGIGADYDLGKRDLGQAGQLISDLWR